MGTTARGRLTRGAMVLSLCLVAACSADGDRAAGPPPSPSHSSEAPGTSGTSGQGERSGNARAKLSDRAGSAAELIASGDGLRVENRSGAALWLVFPDGDMAQVRHGKHVVVHRSCRDTLPLRAESTPGVVVEVHRGPCRQRDTWVID